MLILLIIVWGIKHNMKPIDVQPEPDTETEVVIEEPTDTVETQEDYDIAANLKLKDKDGVKTLSTDHFTMTLTHGKSWDAKVNSKSSITIYNTALYEANRGGKLVTIIAYDAGDELINPLTGETVKSREETYDKTVIAEGNTRLWALLAEMERIEDLKRKRKDGDEKPFEYTLTYRHITDPKVFKNLYRHINIDNVPTRTKDFARDFLATERENKVVTSYSSKIDRGLLPKAAGFATSFKDVKKADIETLLAGKDPAVFNSSNKNDLEISDMIYNGVLEGFAIEKGAPVKNKVLKGSFIWRWIANKMNEADEGDRLDLAVKVISIFTSMSAQDSERINNAEKTETQTREQVIHAILDGMYNKNN